MNISNTTELKQARTKCKLALNKINSLIKYSENPTPYFLEKKVKLVTLIHDLETEIAKDTTISVP